MSRGKESNQNALNNSVRFEKNVLNYHTHHPSHDKDAPEAFTLEPQFNTKLSISMSQD